ncbi:YDG domain-containing protein [Amphibiibacter pelophylacis]|uniref:YDG domain-containing protein n=1 Tax=Amphibiibacter pelophylacis TaxID=1799477 RepID=A0ACC6NYY1_9BURK
MPAIISGGTKSTTGFYSAGSHNLTASGGGTGLAGLGYALAYTPGTLTVAQKALTVSGITAAAKPYDGNTTATVSTAAAQRFGLVVGDVVTVSATGDFDSKNVGANRVVALTSTYGGADRGNYLITDQGSTTASITPKTLTVTGVAAASKTYDGSATATLTSAGGVSTGVASETLGLSNTGATFATKDAGNGKTVTVNGLALQDGANGGLASNYTLASAPATTTANITPKALSASLTGATSKIYDGSTAASLGASNFSLSGFVGSEGATVSQTTGRYLDANAGSGKTVSATLAAGDFSASGATLLSNYALPTSAEGGIGSITPKALTASLTGTTSKTFDGSTAASLGASNFSLFGFVGSEGATVSQTAGRYLDANAGSAKTVSATLSAGDFIASGATLLSNYTLPTSAEGSIGSITPKALTASLTGATRKTYDGSTAASLGASNFSLSGFVDSEGASVSQTAGRYLDANAGISKAVSATLSAGDFSASGATLLSNYSLPTSAQGPIGSIARKAVAITGVAAADKTYDGSTTATLTRAGSVSTGVGDETLVVTADAASAHFSSKDVAADKTVTVTGLALQDGSGGGLASNYALSDSAVTTTASITPKAVTVSGISAADRVYDRTTDATVDASRAVIEGLVGGDQVQVAATGRFSDKNVGADKTVRLESSYSGGDRGNYTIADQASTTASITPRAARVSGITASDKAYDGTVTASVSTSQAAVSGLLDGDQVHVTASGRFADKDAGTHAVALTVSHQGSDAANYSYSDQASATATITPRALTVSGATAADRIYDGTTATEVTDAGRVSTGVGSETLGISAATATADFDTADAGQNKSVTLRGLALQDGSNGGLARNYTLGSAPVTATASIGRRTVMLTGVAVDSKTYDGTTSATVSQPGTLSNVVPGESLGVARGLVQFADPDVAQGKPLKLSGYTLQDSATAKASNYTLSPDLPSTTADITPAEIRVYANADQKFYTQPDAENFAGFSLTGFVHGETADSASVTGSALVTRSNAGTEDAGVYPGVLRPDVGALRAPNYRFTAVNGNYTITPADRLAVRFGASSSLYGDAPGYGTPTAAYLSSGSQTITQVAVADGPDGSYTLTDVNGRTVNLTLALKDGDAAAAVSGSGAIRAGHYDLAAGAGTTPVGGNFLGLDVVGSTTITPRGLALDITSPVSKVYDGTTEVRDLAIGMTGRRPADAVSISGQGEFSQRNVGSNIAYTVGNLRLDGADAANYFLGDTRQLSGTARITPRVITLTAPSVSRVYDGGTGYTASAAELAALATHLVKGDGLAQVTLAFDSKNVGSGKTLTLSKAVIDDGNGGKNYDVTLKENTTSRITRLDSVTWVGAPNADPLGNWFDPANWAGGAVPDLANVAHVVIPAGVTVRIDPLGAKGGAVADQPVQVDGIGSGLASLTLAGGDLQVGADGLRLDALTQSGGALAVAGPSQFVTARVSGGTASLTGDMSVSQEWRQTGGAVALERAFIGGNLTQLGGTLGVKRSLVANEIRLRGGDLSVEGDLDATGVTLNTTEGQPAPRLGVKGEASAGFMAIEGGDATLGSARLGELLISEGSLTTSGTLQADSVTSSGGSMDVGGDARLGDLTVKGADSALTWRKTLKADEVLVKSGELTALGASTLGTATLEGGTSQFAALDVKSLSQTGGSATVSGALTGGSVAVSGGSLTAQGAAKLDSVALSGGSSAFDQALEATSLDVSGDATTLTAAGPTTVDTVTLAGGASALNDLTVTGTLTQSAGALDASGTTTLKRARVTGGTASFAGPLNLAGDYVQQGGTSTAAGAVQGGNLRLEGGRFSATGADAPVRLTQLAQTGGQLDTAGQLDTNELYQYGGMADVASLKSDQASFLGGVSTVRGALDVAQVSVGPGAALAVQGDATVGTLDQTGGQTDFAQKLTADTADISGGTLGTGGPLSVTGRLLLSGPDSVLQSGGPATVNSLVLADGVANFGQGLAVEGTLRQSSGALGVTGDLSASRLAQVGGALTATGTTRAGAASLGGTNSLKDLQADSIAINGGSTTLSGDLTGGDITQSGGTLGVGGDLAVGDAKTLSQTGGTATVGGTLTGGSVNLSGGSLKVDKATAVDGLTVAENGALDAAGPLNANTLTQSGGTLTATDVAVSGPLTQTGGALTATGTTTAKTVELAGTNALNNLSATDSISISGGSTALSGDLTGGDLTISDGSLGVAGATKAVSLTQSGGTITATDVAVSGPITQTGGALTATGTTTAKTVELAGTNALNNLSATDSIAIKGGSTALSGDLTGGDLTLNGNGALDVKGATRADDVVVADDSSLSTAGPLNANTFTQSGGTITATDVAVSGPINQTSGALTATGTTTAKTIELAGTNALKNLSATDSIAINGGDTKLSGDLTGGDLTLSGSGALDVKGTTRADDVVVAEDSSLSTTGPLNASTLTQSGGTMTAIDVAVSGPITQTSGALTATGTMTATTVELAGTNALNNLSATDSIAVKGGSTALSGDLTGGDLTIADGNLGVAGATKAVSLTQSGGTITATDVAVSGPITQTGGALTATGTTTAKTVELAGTNSLKNLSATDSIAIKGGSTALSGDLTGGDLTLSGNGAIDVKGATRADDVVVADDSSLRTAGPLNANTFTQSGGTMTATDVAVSGPITQTGGALTATGTTTAKTVALAGTNALKNLSATDSIAIKGGSTTLSGDLTGGDLALSGSGALDVKGATRADDVVVADDSSLSTTGPLNANTLTQSGGTIAATDVAVNGPITQTGGALTATGTTTAKTVELAGTNALNNLSATDSIAINGGDTKLSGDLTGGDLTLSGSGALDVKGVTRADDVVVADDSSLSTTGPLNANTFAQSGGRVRAGDVAVAGPMSQSGGAMAVSGTLRGDDLSISGGSLSVNGGTSVNRLRQSGGTLDFYGPVNLAGTFSQTGGSATTHGSLKGGSVAVSQSGQFNARSAVDLETLSVDGGRVSLDRGLNARQLDLRGGTLLATGPVNAGTINRSGGNFVQGGQETGLVDPGQVTASVAAPTEGSPVLRNPDTPAPTLTVVGDVTLPPSIRAVTRLGFTPASPGQPATLNVEIRPGAFSLPEGFTFTVPQRVWAGELAQDIRAELPEGRPLPAGLSFDAADQRFTVAPKSGLELPLVVVLRLASGRQVRVELDWDN